ncbi:MAG: hypothetical protein K8R85_10695 [Bacteroidetes bacterium]|nr:hypothetical protein [Bacteroidota bacterium]
MKNNWLLIICILSFNYGYSQEHSRIVFYFKPLVRSPFGIGGGLGTIYFNDGHTDKNTRIRNFVWNTQNANGIYKWVTTDTYPHLEVELNAPENSISFIELKGRFMGLPRLRKGNYTAFKKIYDKEKWYRKRLEKAGYKSAEELVKGYRMNQQNIKRVKA